MKTITMGTVLAVALAASLARAQSDPDHLQCYKVTDATLRHLRATVISMRRRSASLPAASSRRQSSTASRQDNRYRPARCPTDPIPSPSSRITVGPLRLTASVTRSGAPVPSVRRPTKWQPIGSAPISSGGRRPTWCARRQLAARSRPAQGFQVTSPPIDIDPGQDVTYCYYFRTPNLATLAVKRLASAMGPAGRGVVFFTTAENNQAAERRPAGSVSIAECQFFSGTTRPTWRYAGYGASDELAFPADDGNGHPVAMEIPPLSAGVLMMHFKNETSAMVSSTVTLSADALDEIVYTPTATLLSYDATINIPPQTTGHVETQSLCSTHRRPVLGPDHVRSQAGGPHQRPRRIECAVRELQLGRSWRLHAAHASVPRVRVVQPEARLYLRQSDDPDDHGRTQPADG